MTGPFNDNDDIQFESESTAGEAFITQGRVVEQETESKSNVITARGTVDGLVLRVDGRVEPSDLTLAVRDFLESRRSFLQGNDVAFEWVGRKPEEGVINNLTTILSNEFKVAVRSSKLKPSLSRQSAGQQQPLSQDARFDESFLGESSRTTSSATLSSSQSGRASLGRAQQAPFEKSISLFDGIENMESRSQMSTNPMLWDEPDTRLYYGTLRSGQKIETEHSLVVFGDVNSGAEVIAGGDIVILGTLRGIAHAGAYDESGGGRVIFSLNLQPTQLRIGLVISRGSAGDDLESTPRGGIPEIARVQSNLIVVEPYQSRTVWSRRRE